ncbi:MAG: GIY-YIG nuclease family protein [Oscillospiraceae bacterium]|nr:GIY-YIG nuclease family protein [Oscillospiraceae bacterium]
MYYVYMLLCSDDSLYTGITPDLQRRMRQHTGQLKGGARYTTLRPPKQLAAVWTAPDRSVASKAEYAIKHLKSEEKRMLAADPHRFHEVLEREELLALHVFDHPTLQELLQQ